MLDRGTLAAIHARRGARTAAGQFAVLGVFSAALLTLYSQKSGPTLLFLSLWPLTVVVYAVALLVHRMLWQEQTDFFEAWARIHVRARPSLVWPLVGLSALMPLTLHFLVFMLMEGPGRVVYGRGIEHFSVYIGLSSLVVLPAYLMLFYECFAHAKKVLQSAPEHVDQTDGGRALLRTALAGCLPGVAIFGVPPLVVAVTGLFFIPFSFTWIRRLYFKEQASLTEQEQAYAEQMTEERFEGVRELLRSSTSSLPQKIEALEFLARHLPRERLAPTLDATLRSPHEPLLRTTLQICQRITHRPPVSLLTSIAQNARGEAAELATRLLALSQGAAAEPVLLDLLERSSFFARRAAIKALGRVGSREAIGAIRTMLKRSYQEPSLEIVAEEAIKRIKHRVSAGASQIGALAVVEDAAQGAISLSDKSQGQISVC